LPETREVPIIAAMSTERLPREIPPVWQVGAIGVMVALHFLWPVDVWIPRPWNYMGWAVIVVSLALQVSNLQRFRRVGTGLRPFDPVSQLVVEGAYRWSRNPMYVGLVVTTVGVAVCLGTVTPWFVPPLLWLVLDRRFVRREERFLRQEIGAEYEIYCQSVRRWL